MSSLLSLIEVAVLGINSIMRGSLSFVSFVSKMSEPIPSLKKTYLFAATAAMPFTQFWQQKERLLPIKATPYSMKLCNLA